MFGGDPYRVLGVPPDASLAEVKRAYRGLAKRHHPDAGEGSVARFLEVQAAYEALIRTGADGVGRARGGRPPGRGPTPASGAPRGATGSAKTTGPAGRPGHAGGAGAAASTTDAGRADRDPGAGQAGTRGRRRRDPRKATLGSTSYDDAAEIAEPAWDGADWYGPASGTYWTLNPKEYADPRKHGPEYLARWLGTRRPEAPDRARFASEPLTASSATEAGRSPGAAAWQDASRPQAAAQARATAGSAEAGRSHGAPAPPPMTRRRVEHPAWPRPLERAVLGTLGWLPLGLLLAAAAGLPGGLIATLPLQAVGLIAMLRAPRLAWASAGGAAAVVACAIPAVAALAALGRAIRPGEPAPVPLIGLLVLAWWGGVGLAASGRLIARPWRTGP